MKKILVFGGAGMVGSRFLELYQSKYQIIAPTIEEFDFLNFPATKNLVEKEKPDVILNFAAMTNVEAAEDEKDNLEGLTYKVNALAVQNLSEIAREFGIQLIHISTEYVFDGEKERPYTEEDIPNPVNWYGQTKYVAEKFVQESGCDYSIVRISMPYSANFDLKKDIARKFLEMLHKKEEIKAIADSDITPVLVDSIADALSRIITERKLGLYHVVSTNSTTPYEFAKLIAKAFGLDEDLVNEVSFDEYNKDKKAKLLKHSWLDCSKYVSEFGEGILKNVEESIEIFKKLS